MWGWFRALKPWQRRYLLSLSLGAVTIASILFNHIVLDGYVDGTSMLIVGLASLGCSIWLQRGVAEAFATENPNLRRWVTTDSPWWSERGPWLPVWAVILWHWISRSKRRGRQ